MTFFQASSSKGHTILEKPVYTGQTANSQQIRSNKRTMASHSFVATFIWLLIGSLQLEPSASFSLEHSSTQRSLRQKKNDRGSTSVGTRSQPPPPKLLLYNARNTRLKLATTPTGATTTSDPFSLEASDELERRTEIHNVIEGLKAQIPTLLSTPMAEASAKIVYADDIQLVVEDIVLASSRDELISLSNTLVLAVVATNQANSFFSSASVFGRAATATTTGDAAEPSSPASSGLESKLAIDPSLQAIRVQWQVNLPGERRQLQGVSELQLDTVSHKVSTLRLLQVQWNGEQLNARAIGESLASLRQLVLTFQDAPVLKSLGVPSLSSLLGPDFMQQITAATASSSGSEKIKAVPPSLFVTDSLDAAFVTPKRNSTKSSSRVRTTTTSSSKNATTKNATTTDPSPPPAILTPIDNYDGRPTSSWPLPGSKVWNRFVLSRQLYQTFLNETLPVLSGNRIVPSREMISLFSSQSKLIAVDGSKLLRGRDQVGNYFHTLASWRKRSSGTWEVTNATLLSWDKELTIAVGYKATSKLPGSSAPAVIEGVDHFVLEPVSSDAPSTASSSSTEDDKDDDEPMDIAINRIEQKKLDIGGVGTRSPDGLWFMTSLVSALDTGKFSSVGGDSVVMDLLQRVIAGDITLSASASASGDVKAISKRRRRFPPKLSESVAARVYTIMANLHEEVPLILDKDNLSMYQPPPLSELMTDTIELRGYLGETLARGSSAYKRAVGASFASLKAAQATGSVKMERDPTLAVELTAEGTVRSSLTLFLKVLPLPSGTSDLINSISGKAISLPSGGFPLEMSLVSDYVIEKETGDIIQQRLIESRVNGQLTPGDVLSKWIQKQSSTNPKGRSDAVNGAAFQKSLVDAISWVRSMNQSRG